MEIKDSAAVDDVVTVIRSAGLTDVCTISCFDEVVLARVKEMCPALATAWFHLAPGPLAAADLVARLGVELLIVWPPAAHPDVIAAAQEAGMAIRSGLPDNLTYEQTAAEVRRMVELGIPEISCGRPDWIGRAFGELE